MHVCTTERHFGTLCITDIPFGPAFLTINCRQEQGLLVIATKRLHSLLCFQVLLHMCKVADESTLKLKISSISLLKIAENPKCPMYVLYSYILYSSPHSGELLSASVGFEPEASTPGKSRSENVVILFPHPCEPLTRSTWVSSQLSPDQGRRTHTFLRCEKYLHFFFLAFLGSIRQASPAEESSRLDPVYFTLKKQQRDAGAILYLKEPQTSEEKKSR